MTCPLPVVHLEGMLQAGALTRYSSKDPLGWSRYPWDVTPGFEPLVGTLPRPQSFWVCTGQAQKALIFDNILFFT
jgi:hypothetical protein